MTEEESNLLKKINNFLFKCKFYKKIQFSSFNEIKSVADYENVNAAYIVLDNNVGFKLSNEEFLLLFKNSDLNCSNNGDKNILQLYTEKVNMQRISKDDKILDFLIRNVDLNYKDQYDWIFVQEALAISDLLSLSPNQYEYIIENSDLNCFTNGKDAPFFLAQIQKRKNLVLSDKSWKILENSTIKYTSEQIDEIKFFQEKELDFDVIETIKEIKVKSEKETLTKVVKKSKLINKVKI